MLSDAASAGSRANFAENDREARELLRDLHRHRRWIYWLDLLVSSSVGWIAFAFAVWFPLGSPPMLLWGLLATFALYRALCFLHEISHFQSARLHGFEAVWNLIIGYPALMPSIVYVGVHQDHHGLSSYGTVRDPEYMPFASSSAMTVAFLLQSFLIPLALMLRFLFLGPLGLVSKPLNRWLAVHASALTMNLKYRREWAPELARRIRSQNSSILLLWGTVTVMAIAGWIPWRIFIVWIGVMGLMSFFNTLRTLSAHAYESSGESMDRAGQVADSIDTPGALWTELWAPVGLRYHALHHYFPGLPYHNLGKAHRRLVNALPKDSLYHQAASRGMLHSLRRLYVRGRRRPVA
jgi:fatty acid desaturase